MLIILIYTIKLHCIYEILLVHISITLLKGILCTSLVRYFRFADSSSYMPTFMEIYIQYYIIIYTYELQQTLQLRHLLLKLYSIHIYFLPMPKYAYI